MNIEPIIKSILPDVENYDFSSARKKLSKHLHESNQIIHKLYSLILCIENCHQIKVKWNWNTGLGIPVMLNQFMTYTNTKAEMEMKMQLIQQLKEICSKYCDKKKEG